MFGIFKRRSEQTPEPKEFPPSGIYKGVEYRIDGDSVMLTCSNGKEIAFKPSSRITPGAFDEERSEVLKGSDPRGLSLATSEAFDVDKKPAEVVNVKSNMGPSRSSYSENLARSGISETEHKQLAALAREVIAGYWKSHARTKVAK